MADKTSNGVSGRSDLDPFAELTRIMGFDPRVPVEASEHAAAGEPSRVAPQPIMAERKTEPAPPVQNPVEIEANDEGFGIDLEKELLGAFDDDEPAPSVEPEERDVVSASGFDQAEDDEAPIAVVADAPEIDLVGIEDEISKHVDAFMAVDRADEPADMELASADNEDVIESEPEAALEESSDAEEAPEASASASTEQIDLDRSLDDAFADADAPDRMATRDVEWEPAPFLATRPQSQPAVAHRDASLADVDMDFDAGADEASAVATELEAEYNALLGNGALAPDMSVDEPALSKQREAEMRTASIVSAGWRKSSTADANDVAEPQAAAPMDRGAMVRDRLPVPDDAELEPDLIEALEAAAAEPVSPEPYPVAAKSEPTPEDPFAALAAMAARYQTGQQENSWREATSKYETPPAPRVETEQPIQAKYYAAQSARQAAPDIETVDVHDGAVALADDLDIPEISYDEPPVDRYDDLDVEFNNLLNEMSTGERREPAMQANASIHRQPAYVEQRPTRQQMPTGQAPTEHAYRDDRYDTISDQDFERAMAAFEAEAEDEDDDQDFGPPMTPIAEKRPRRGLWVAALVGGLALIGGISAVALSFGSNSAAEIAMIKADNKPIKVRPENPGGSTVPNQDSTVYDTVSRSDADQASTQERLVNTAEEPLELPSLNEEEGDDVAAVAKDEDRVEPTPEPEMASQETIAVAPRKVRTMVVKSDGTLVPREEPAVEPAAQKAAAQPTSDAATGEDLGTEQITTGATKPSKPAAQAPEKIAALPAALEKPAAAPAAGAWSVQVSSSPNEDGANKSLKDISRKYAGVIGGRSPNVVKAEVDGKGTMWRVRIPAGSRDEAIGLCGSLKAAGGSCFVTK